VLSAIEETDCLMELNPEPFKLEKSICSEHVDDEECEVCWCNTSTYNEVAPIITKRFVGYSKARHYYEGLG